MKKGFYNRKTKEKKIVPMTPEEIALSNEEQEQYQNKIRRNEILNRLVLIDKESIRPIRAGETDKINELENEAIALREELKDLEE